MIWTAVERGLSQDTAAWAQAAGSILAIGVAVWISDRENFLRRKERVDEQEASVWAVLYALNLAETETAIIYWELKESGGSVDEDSWKNWITMCRNSRAMLDYAADRIDHYHPGFAQEAHNAKILADELIEILDDRRTRRAANGVQRDVLLTELGNRVYNFSLLAQRIGSRMFAVRRRTAAGKRILHDWDSYDGPRFFDVDGD
jgi:hypothetical protein